MGQPSVLFQKLAKVMTAISSVPKRGRNDFHKYNYVLEADLAEAVRSELSQRHIMVFTSIDTVQREGTLTTIQTSFTFADGETGETFTVKGAGSGDDKGDKGLYKAITGAVKYMLMKTFLIPTGDDPEADEDTDRRSYGNKSTEKKSPPPKEEPKTPPANAPAEVAQFVSLQKKLTEHFAFGPKHYHKLCNLPKGKIPPTTEEILAFKKEGNLKWLAKLNAAMEKELAASPEKQSKEDEL